MYSSEMDRRAPDSQQVNQRRLGAVLRLRGFTLAGICREVGRAPRHLQFALRGERVLTDPLLSALREAAGPVGWAFVVGETDRLPDDGSEPVGLRCTVCGREDNSPPFREGERCPGAWEQPSSLRPLGGLHATICRGTLARRPTKHGDLGNPAPVEEGE